MLVRPGSVSVIDYQGLDQNKKRVVALYLLLMLSRFKMDEPNYEPGILLVIDEAELLFPANPSKGDKAQLDFMGVNTDAIRDNMIGLRGNKKDLHELVKKYLIDMKAVMSEMQRVLKDDGYAVVVIGTNATQLQKISEFIDGRMKLEDELINIGKKAGLSLSQRISRPIEGIRNSIRNEEILIFKKIEKAQWRLLSVDLIKGSLSVVWVIR